MGGSFDRALTRIENVVMLVSYSVLILVVGVETLRRIVTREQAAWGPEVAMYAFIWLSWFAMSSNTRLNRHLAFTELRERFPPAVRAVFEGFDCLLWFGVGLILIWTSIEVVATNIRLGQVVFGTDIPLWAASVAVPIGWGMTMLRVVQRFWAIVTARQAELLPHAAPQDVEL